MDSAADNPKTGARMMPLAAILGYDLRTLWTSRLVHIWLIAAVLLTLFLTAGNWANFQDAPLIASLLFPFLVFPWFFVVVVLGVSGVSGSRAESLADGILSRPISRIEYLLAAWLARVLLVLSVFLLAVVPAAILVIFARRPVADDSVTVFGLISSLFVVALVLTFLVSLGFLTGILLRKSLLAVVILVFLWYPIGLILNVFSLEQFSPISLNQAVSTQLRRPLIQSDEKPADDPKLQGAEAFTRQVDHFFNVLSGTKPQPQTTKPEFFERDHYKDFSLLNVTLGYGLPTLLTVLLAAVCFQRRDL